MLLPKRSRLRICEIDEGGSASPIAIRLRALSRAVLHISACFCELLIVRMREQHAGFNIRCKRRALLHQAVNEPRRVRKAVMIPIKYIPFAVLPRRIPGGHEEPIAWNTFLMAAIQKPKNSLIRIALQLGVEHSRSHVSK
ncbi:hypothetical protein D3C78_764450 [compost metagenome]